MAYTKPQLKAYRVQRKLLGLTGAPTVTVQQEFWRFRMWAREAERAELTAYLAGRQRQLRAFGGPKLWRRSITVSETGVIRAFPAVGNASEIVGRVYRDVVVLHRKKAPRWLLNWRWRSGDVAVYVLDSLSAAALRRYRQELREEQR